jgi:hypothetical protein
MCIMNKRSTFLSQMSPFYINVRGYNSFVKFVISEFMMFSFLKIKIGTNNTL